MKGIPVLQEAYPALPNSGTFEVKNHQHFTLQKAAIVGAYITICARDRVWRPVKYSELCTVLATNTIFQQYPQSVVNAFEKMAEAGGATNYLVREDSYFLLAPAVAELAISGEVGHQFDAQV